MARLRFALALQAAGLAVPIAAAVLYLGLEFVYHEPCDRENCAGGMGIVFLGYAIFLFAGPLWWAASGARRAAHLTARNLAWLITVDLYLVIAAVFAYAIFKGDGVPFDGLATLLLLVLVPPALLSAALCAERIWRLRRQDPLEFPNSR